MQGKLLFLGTGSSMGIPMIGCPCGVCHSQNILNQRLRPSVLIDVQNKRILIDIGPDFRIQALKYGINHLDGVILTHTHFDHIAGLDELRTFYILNRQSIPVLLSSDSFSDLKQRYPYLFRQKSWGTSLSAQLTFHLLENERGNINFLDHRIGYMTYEQGGMKVNGYRFGNLAYISDIKNYSESLLEDLYGVEILIISGQHSPMHLSIEEGMQLSQKVNPQKTYFTHISHESDHEEVNRLLPSGYALAYDGLTLNFNII